MKLVKKEAHNVAPASEKKLGVVTGSPKQFDTQVATDVRPVVRAGLLTLLLGAGGFLVWAGFAPLDQGITLPGVVNVDSKRKTVQHLRGGIVQEILVHDGDNVKSGQVILRLNNTQAKAQLGEVKSQYYSAKAMEDRLEAERIHAGTIKFSDELIQLKEAEPQVASSMMVQEQLFKTRRESLRSEISIFNENIAAQNAQIKGLESLAQSKSDQLKLVQEELGALRKLFGQGYVPRSRLFDLERAYADIQGTRSEDIGNVGRLKKSIGELRLRIVQRQQEFQKEVETQLSDLQRQSAALKERMIALQDEVVRTEIKAPNSGVVVGLNVHTVGGVIGPGEKILDIVPQDEQLVVEAQLMPNDITKVHAGLPTDIHFTAFNQKHTPIIEGKVISVSADRLTDPRTGMPYYISRVVVTQNGMKELREKKLIVQPGMPADVVVRTGERTMLQYLVKPLTDRMSFSLKEE